MPPAPAAAPIPWWEDRRYAWALILASAIPLVWPQLPPITDALGHLARYHIELNLDRSPALARYYAFDWALIGNLGIDLLVIPLAPLLGLELAVKLIVLAIPALTAAGLLAVARELHGRLPATAAFALPLAYGYPFQFGFINFCLSMALALLAFALWLRLARQGRDALRAILFVPIGCLVWLCHIYGWGVLGLLGFSAELVRDRGAGGSRLHAIGRAVVATLPLAPPILLMLAWRSGNVAGFTGDWFNWMVKLAWLAWALRDRWQWFDVGAVTLIVTVIAIAAYRRDMARAAGLAALVLLLTFLLLPRILLGSAYADMRLVPFVLAVAVIGIVPVADLRTARWIALAGLAFFAARTAATTVSFWRYDRAHQAQLRALDHIRPGARVMVLVAVECHSRWLADRMDHLGSMATVRRDAFANGQWVMAGAQLLRLRYTAAGRFSTDPSQLLHPIRCRARNEPIWADTMANFPREAFDYLWLINMGPSRWPQDPGLIPIWSFNRGILYRVDPTKPKADYSATSASDTPNGKVPRRNQ